MKDLKLILTSSAIVIAVAASFVLREKKQNCPCIQSPILQKKLTDSANFLHATP
jgi:hypothetical protein